MADEEETAAPTYSVEYLGAGKTEEPIGWISKAGKANVKYANGDTYCGDYNELKQRHGRGRYTYIRKGNEEDEEAKPTTSVYDGDFRLGKKHGMGTMTYPDGGKYNGSWENDKKHGNGSYEYANGDIYNGEWVEDKKNGAGSYYYASNKSQLVGEWKDNKYVKGKWVHKDNTSYHSSFDNNLPVGNGIYYFAKSGNQMDGTYSTESKGEDEGEEGGAPSSTWVSGSLTKASVNAIDLTQS